MALAGECWGLDAILRRGVSGSPISLEKVRWRLIVPSFEMMRQIGRVFQALSRAGDFGCPVQGDGVVRVAARDERGAAETLFRASEVFWGSSYQTINVRSCGSQVCAGGGRVPVSLDPNRRRGVSDLRRVQKQ